MKRNDANRFLTLPRVAGLWICLLWATPSFSGEPIDGFRDLKFGMTEQEVSGLAACSSSKACMYELSDKNRYIELFYMGEKTEDTALQTALNGEGKGLARISIDMGHYTEEWFKQLQIILSNSYKVTQDLQQETIQAFLAEEQSELTKGYDNGQVLLTVYRRPFGNLVLKVIYQSPSLARAFVKSYSRS